VNITLTKPAPVFGDGLCYLNLWSTKHDLSEQRGEEIVNEKDSVWGGVLLVQLSCF